MDPEIPVLNVNELGVVRDIAWHGERLRVDVTPTYSGCPAARVIEAAIEARIRAGGIADVEVRRVLTPPWSSTWMRPEAREKLRAYRIVPPEPERAGGAFPWSRTAPQIECPACGASDPERISEFGSTPCKAQYRCTRCLEPFEYFKCI